MGLRIYSCHACGFARHQQQNPNAGYYGVDGPDPSVLWSADASSYIVFNLNAKI